MISVNLIALLGIIILGTSVTANKCVKHAPRCSSSNALQEVSAGTNAFSMELYMKLKQAGENLIVSPVSLQVLLALLYTGARGNSATQIANTIHLPSKLKDVLQGYKLLIQQLKDNPVLLLATKMFIENSFNVKREFQCNAVKYFFSEVEMVNFSGDPGGAVNEINSWVAENTNGTIQDLVSQESITPITLLVLVNAIYFKDKWQYQFDPEDTVEQNFFVTPENTISVQMMRLTAHFLYKEDDDLNAKILLLPYTGGEFGMIMILPNNVDGLEAVEDKLGGLDLNQILDGMQNTTVEVNIPRFKLENSLALVGALSDMGIVDIFTTAADLSGIADSGLMVSDVLQNAYIEVNEEGTEAAAATGVIIVPTAIQEPMTFIADHPFLFFLKKKDVLLFMGRVVNVE